MSLVLNVASDGIEFLESNVVRTKLEGLVGGVVRIEGESNAVGMITNLAAPVNASDAVNKSYIDNLAHTFTITDSSNVYVFNGHGTTNSSQPSITLQRGHLYNFVVNAAGKRFWLKSAPGSGSSNQLGTSDGVTNNGQDSGTIIYRVPQSATGTQTYQCDSNASMVGTIYFADRDTTDTTVSSGALSGTDLTLTMNDSTTSSAIDLSTLQQHSIDKLTDVDVTTAAPLEGQSIIWDGSTKFVPSYDSPFNAIVAVVSGQYRFNGLGMTNNDSPTLALTRGQTYYFTILAPGAPFYIKTANSAGTGNLQTAGVTNNGTENGILKFTVPIDCPPRLYYRTSVGETHNGEIRVTDISGQVQTGDSKIVVSDTSIVSSIGATTLLTQQTSGISTTLKTTVSQLDISQANFAANQNTPSTAALNLKNSTGNTVAILDTGSSTRKTQLLIMNNGTKRVQFKSDSSEHFCFVHYNSNGSFGGNSMKFTNTGAVGFGDYRASISKHPPTDFSVLGSATFEADMIIGTSNAIDPSAILQLSSTTKGFIPPVLTTTQRDAIATPATGLLVFNSTDDTLNLRSSTGWGSVLVNVSAAAPANQQTLRYSASTSKWEPSSLPSQRSATAFLNYRFPPYSGTVDFDNLTIPQNCVLVTHRKLCRGEEFRIPIDGSDLGSFMLGALTSVEEAKYLQSNPASNKWIWAIHYDKASGTLNFTGGVGSALNLTRSSGNSSTNSLSVNQNTFSISIAKTSTKFEIKYYDQTNTQLGAWEVSSSAVSSRIAFKSIHSTASPPLEIFVDPEHGRIKQAVDTSTSAPSVVGQGLSWDGAAWSTHSDGRQHYVQGDLIPKTNLTYSIGSAEKQFKELFVGEGSIYLGNGGKISFEGGKVAVKQRDLNTVPTSIASAGGTESSALTHSGRSALNQLTNQEWINYANTLSSFNNNANISLVFDSTYNALTGDVAAFLVQNSGTTASGSQIMFDTVVTNEASGFNTTSKKFVAPHAGFYLFAWSGSGSTSNANSTYSLRKGGVVQAVATTTGANDTASGFLVLQLAVNDTVDVLYSSTDSSTSTGGVTKEFFSGSFINYIAESSLWNRVGTNISYTAGQVSLNTPTANAHAATKQYVDQMDVASGTVVGSKIRLTRGNGTTFDINATSLKKTDTLTIQSNGIDGLTVSNGTYTGDSTTTTTIALPQALKTTSSPSFIEVNTTSCLTMKRNVSKMGKVLEKVNNIPACNFEWKHKEGEQIGLIAQDIERQFPEAVSEVDGIKRVNNSALIALLFGAVKDLTEKLDDLKSGK